MASLALGVVGAFAGSFVGMPQLGFMIGSAIGGMLSQPVQGNRLGEIDVQTSSYGSPLPIPYGVPAPISGTVIWMTNITESTQSSGGKGGPKTYKYSQSYAIAICEGPVSAITRIWKSGQLIYSVLPGADVQTLVQSSDGSLASILGITPHGSAPSNQLSSLPSNMKLYLGTSTQLPDPTIEAAKGVGNVSAMRGTCYAVVTNDDVTQNGGRAWQYTFEVATGGTHAGALAWQSYQNILAHAPANIANTWLGEFMQAPCADSVGMHVFSLNVDNDGLSHLNWPLSSIDHWVVPYTGAPYKLGVLPASAGLNWLVSSTQQTWNAANEAWTPSHTQSDIPGVFLLAKNPTDGNQYVTWIDGAAMAIVPLWMVPTALISAGLLLQGAAMLSSNWMIALNNVAQTTPAMFINGIPIAMPTGYSTVSDVIKIWVSSQYFWVVMVQAYPATGIAIHRYGTGGQFIDSTPMPAGVHQTGFFGVFDDDHAILIYPSTSDLWLWSISAQAWSSGAYVTAIGTAHGAQLSTAAGEASFQACGSFFALRDYAAISWSSIYVSSSTPQNGVAHIYTSGYTPASVTVGSVQSDICSRVGISGGQVDVSALTQVIIGYLIDQRTTGRDASMPLMACFFYDSVEHDNKLNFVNRGAYPTLTIPLDDLAAHEATAMAKTPDPIIKVRSDRTVLPTQVDVAYYDPINDTQLGLQSSQRLTVDNRNPQTLSYDTVVMNADYAMQVAEVNLYQFWAQANAFQFQTGLKWQHLTPTDVVTLGDAGTVRITKKKEGANGVVMWEAVSELPEAYVVSAIGVAGSQAGQSQSAYPGPTRLELMDIPILRDQDDDYGFYLAASGYTSQWMGCTVYKSTDGGTSYAEFVTPPAADVMGYATTGLDNWDGSNRLDYKSSVTVALTDGGTLSSCTFTQLLNNSNPILIGSELCNYMTATLVSSGVYTLTGLLRGRRGTEWACTGHVAGERVVALVSPSVLRGGSAPTDVNLLRDYKAVSAGTSLAVTGVRAFTNTCVGKMPYAPVRVGAYKNTDGSWQLVWNRRSRIDNYWHSYASMPIGETSEAYSVDIYDSTGTVFKRTYNGLTSATCHYLLADVTTDGTSAHFLFKVYQIGALGRGFAGTYVI